MRTIESLEQELAIAYKNIQHQQEWRDNLNYELKRTKRALWLARADAANLMATREAFAEYKREHPYSIWNDVRGGYSGFCSYTNWSRLFIKVERKCRAYADKFKEEK